MTKVHNLETLFFGTPVVWGGGSWTMHSGWHFVHLARQHLSNWYH